MSLTGIGLAMILALTPPSRSFVDEVHQAELAFAKAFADRDQAAFFAMVADDATFLSPGTMSIGKRQVIERWSRYFESAEAPFSWAPDRVSVSGDGTLAVSTGPVYDADGNHIGDFISTWRREGKGTTWKIVFDSNGPGPVVFAEQGQKVEEGYVTTPDGKKLFYRRVGRGPVTAIVPLDFLLFDQMTQFANVATIITYDLRNRGRSDRAQNVTLQDDVRDLEAVRAHFKLDKFVPIGFSYLGKMVVLYAAAHPDRVSRLIQLGPIGIKRVDMPIAQEFGAPPELVAKWQEMQTSGGVTKTPYEACIAMNRVMAYYMTGDPKNARKFDVAGACAHESEWPVNVNPHFASLLSSPATLTAEELKAKVTMPVLTIHGTKDRQAAYEGGLGWVRTLPDARLLTLDGAAHAMWLDDPAQTFGAIRQFLRGEWPLGATQLPTSDAPSSGHASTPTAPDAGGSAPRTDS